MEEIKRLVNKQDYKNAMEVVDSIDWRRVKSVQTLCVVGEIYAANKRYEDSKEIFLLAYHRAPIGKNILYRLIEVSLKMKDIDEANEFYEEYLEVAPNDSTQYILKYKIARVSQAPLEEQIRLLEEYKEREFTERWSYELAKLYYQHGDKDKCLELCNEMILWFSEGKYVMKALDLKNRMGQLTGEEKEKFENQFVPKLAKVEDLTGAEKEAAAAGESADSSDGEDAPVIENVNIDERDVNNAESFQEKISRGIRDIFNSRKKEDSGEEESVTDEVQDEMIRDGSSKEEGADVPQLEPEETPDLETETAFYEEAPEQEIPSEEAIENETEKLLKEEADEVDPEDEELIGKIKAADTGAAPKAEKVSRLEDEQELTDPSRQEKKDLPELEMPESMKDMGIKDPLKEQEDDSTDAMDFNLEDRILSAASAQGIKIPKESAAPRKAAPRYEEDDQEEMTEEDLRQAEHEFLNGPYAKAPKEKKPEEFEAEGVEEEYDDFDGYAEDQEDGFYSDDGQDEDSFEDEDDFYESEDAEEELDEEDEFDDEDGYEDFDSEEEEFDELPPMIKKPDPARKTVFREEAPVRKPAAERPAQRKPAPKKPAQKPAASGRRRPLSQEEELELFVDRINPQEPMKIIPREKKLTENEKKLFTYFAKVPGLREQLVDALCDVQMAAADKTSKTGNIIVMGGRETGKTRLISALIPAICKELNLEAAKVAYVFADQINGKNIPEIVRKMAGGFLVIENANQLKKDTVNQLSKAMDGRTDGMIVILEDEKIGMRKLMARFPKFTSRFTSMINLPVFTNDELVNFAKVYTREKGYTIDQMAMLTLYNLISTNQKEDQPMNIGAVKNIIDSAIAKSRGGIRKLKRNISKNRTDSDGYVVLYEKDFN